MNVEFVPILLLHLTSVTYSMDQMCRLPPTSDPEGMRQPGDIMIGALVPINSEAVYQKLTFDVRPPKTSCRFFNLEYYHRFQALLFTVEQINQDPNILPNMTVGFQVYDTCEIPHYELQGALQFLTDSSTTISDSQCSSRLLFPAVIGSTASANSVILAHVLGTFRYPRISPFSSVSILSNRRMFPSFFRTVLNDIYQSKGIAQLVLKFGWTWIGLLALDNDYGLQGIQPIKEEIIKAGACVAFMEYIRVGQPDRNAPHVVKVIKESTATVVVVYANEVEFVPILNEMLLQNVTGKIFIGNSAWARSLLLSKNKYFITLSGSLSFTVYTYNIPGLSQFLVKVQPTSKWNKMMWETVFNCQFLPENQTVSFENPVKICTGLENLENITKNPNYISSLKPAYYIFAAVHVLVKALDDLRNCKIGDGPFSNGTCANIWNFKPWQLLYYIRRVKVNLNTENGKFFNENGNPPGVANIANWQFKADGTLTHVNIGTYNVTAPLPMTINSSLIVWKLGSKQIPSSSCSTSCTVGFRKVILRGKPSCCYSCVPCLQGEISNQTDSIICFSCPWDQWPNPEKSKCLPKPFEFLSYEDVLGTTLVTISIISSIFPVVILVFFFHKKNTPLVKASNYSLSCLLLISLSLCFLCSLGFVGYPDHDKCLLRQVSFGLVFTLCVACILAKTIMVVFAFMATRPGSSLTNWIKFKASYSLITICCLLQLILCTSWLSTAPPFAQYNTNITPEIVIVDCNEGSPIAFWTMLGFLFLLATISFIVAFLARRLPDSFNEAQFITFSMLAFISVWISYIPASLSAQGKYTVAMEIFAILASSWALLICMFLPKCFFILFRPGMNSRENIMRKNIDSRIYIQLAEESVAAQA